jgi:hypothetical protein
VLSDYAKRLESHVRTSYLQKIAVVGVDPACLLGDKLDSECLPPIEATDLVTYFVLETSYYTLQQFKAFKSLDYFSRLVSCTVNNCKISLFQRVSSDYCRLHQGIQTRYFLLYRHRHQALQSLQLTLATPSLAVASFEP